MTKLKLVALVEGYVKRSKAMDQRLEDIRSEIDAINERIAKKQQLQKRLVDMEDYITDAHTAMDGLRERFHDATFRQDEDALNAIQQQRSSILADIQACRDEQAVTQKEIDAIVIDTVAIANHAANLEKGLKVPSYADLIKTVTEELRTLAEGQAAQLKALRSSVPHRYADKEAYDAAMKQLDPRYRTDEQRRADAKKAQEAREAELEALRRSLDGPKTAEEVAAMNRANMHRAAQPAVVDNSF